MKNTVQWFCVMALIVPQVLWAQVSIEPETINTEKQPICIKGDCQQGFGIKEYPNGGRYEGNFKDGKRLDGTLTLSDGTTIVSSDFILGESFTGTINYPNGDVYKGFIRYETVQPTNTGKITYADGTEFEGRFSEGYPVVEGIRLKSSAEVRSFNHFNNGSTHYTNKEWQSAISEYSEAAKLSERFPAVFVFRGMCYKQLGQYNEALQDFQKALNIDPKRLDVLYEVFDMYYLQSDFKNALVYANKMVATKPGLWEVHYHQGRANTKLGNHLDAEKDLSKAIELNNGRTELYYERGYVRFLYAQSIDDIDQNQAREYVTKAKGDFEIVVKAHPEQLSYVYALGQAEDGLGNYAAAITHYDKVITLRPEFGEAYFRKANCKYGLSEFESACEIWRKAESLGYTKAKENITNFCKK